MLHCFHHHFSIYKIYVLTFIFSAETILCDSVFLYFVSCIKTLLSHFNIFFGSAPTSILQYKVKRVF